MEEMSKEQLLKSASLMRKLQFIVPVSMLLIAGGLYLFWGHEWSNMVSAIIALLSIPDFFVFKYLGDQFESRLNKWPN